MPSRKRKAPNRAPTAQDHWRQKKFSSLPSITDLILEAYNTGKTIPIIDKETFQSFKKAQPPPVTPKTPKRQVNPPTPPETKPLPEPKFSINESYELKDMPEKPKHYVRYIESTKEEEDSRVDYDMDEEDIAWLEKTNKERVDNGLDKISFEAFETLMDRFEKECYYKVRAADDANNTLNIQEDEAVCCICSDGTCQANNEILFCDMCNLAVHQECYGVPYIPQGQWLCRRCLNSPSEAINCLLCPSSTGALKMTNDGQWAHILCAMWIPEVQFANPVFLEPIESIDKIPAGRWKLTCSLCKQKGIGACIQCMRKKCGTSFHATCAQQAGVHLKFSGRPGDPSTKSNRSALCKYHMPESTKEDDDNFHDLKKKMLLSVKSPILFEPTVPAERIQDIGKLVDFEKKNVFVTRILAYWMLKRRSRRGAPLVQRDYVMQDNFSEDVSKRLADIDDVQNCYKTKWHHRQNMERVRLLLELVKKRERNKLELIKVHEKLTIGTLVPIVLYLRKLIVHLRNLDDDEVFDRPVDTSQVPNYSKIIKNPMDFSTMSYKIDAFCYLTLEEFESDFNLMINNCLRFNEKNTFYHKAALKLRQRSKPILRRAREDVKDLDDIVPTLQAIKNEPRESSNETEEETNEIDQSKKKKHCIVTNGNEASNFTVKNANDQKIQSNGLNHEIKKENSSNDSVSSMDDISYSKRIRTTSNRRNESQYSL